MQSANNTAQLTALVSMFVAQLPILLVSLLGCVVIATRRNDLSAASSWALMGFGLSVVLCVLIPVGQMLVQNWAMQGGGTLAQRATAFTALAIVWSLLRAVSYGLLLMALCVRQPANEARMENRG